MMGSPVRIMPLGDSLTEFDCRLNAYTTADDKPIFQPQRESAQAGERQQEGPAPRLAPPLSFPGTQPIEPHCFSILLPRPILAPPLEQVSIEEQEQGQEGQEERRADGRAAGGS